MRSSETLKNATDTINTGRYALDKKKQQDQQSKVWLAPMNQTIISPALHVAGKSAFDLHFQISKHTH